MLERALPVVVVLGLLAAVPVSADTTPDLYVRKAMVSVKESRQGPQARDALRAEGTFAAEKLPSGFRFDPALHTVRIRLEGRSVAEFVAGAHPDRWKEKLGMVHSLRVKDGAKWRVLLNTASGAFILKGSRLDLGALGVADFASAALTLEIDGREFTASVNLQAKGRRWAFKAPRNVSTKPVIPPGPVTPPPTSSDPIPAPSRKLYEGTQDWRNPVWTNRTVITTQSGWTQAWTNLFGRNTAEPAVDFVKEVVVLNVAPGDSYSKFEVFYVGTGLLIEYFERYNGYGRRAVNRATAVPRVAGPITILRR